MRLQIKHALPVLLWASSAASDGRVGSWVSVYSSSDSLTVISPRVAARAPVREGLDAEAGYEADIITAASVDVMTAASPRGYREVRHGLTAGATFRPWAGTTLGARYMPSWEPDYASHTFSLGGEREWLDRRLTTGLSYRLGLDAVGRSGEPRASWRSLTANALSADVAWVFGPRTVGHLAYELQMLDGFQASPYRLARVTPAGASPSIGVAEAVPDKRLRHALTAGLRQALARGWFVSTSYRLYADSWGVVSHTEEAELQRAFDRDRFIVGLGARTYGQGAASFYERAYYTRAGSLPRYRTADKMLAPSSSVLAGLRLELGLGDAGPLREIRVAAKGEFYLQRFLDFDPLTARRALITSLGASGEF